MSIYAYTIYLLYYLLDYNFNNLIHFNLILRQMKKFILFVAFLFSLGMTHAQVDIQLKGNAPNNVPKLEAWITPKNFISGDFMNSLTFTIRWPTSYTGVGLNGAAITSNYSGLTMTATGVFTIGSYNYMVINGANTNSPTPTNGVPLQIMSIPITGTIGTCPFCR